MYVFWSLQNYGKHGIQLFCDVLNYQFVIVLQKSSDHIDHGLFFFFFLIIFHSHSTGEIIFVLSPSCMQQRRRLGSRFTSMNLGDLQTAINWQQFKICGSVENILNPFASKNKPKHRIKAVDLSSYCVLFLAAQQRLNMVLKGALCQRSENKYSDSLLYSFSPIKEISLEIHFIVVIPCCMFIIYTAATQTVV